MERRDVRQDAERWWNGEADLAVAEHPVAPTHRYGQEIADGVLYFKSIASATTLDTGDGLVMLDTGGQFDTAVLHEEVRAWRPRARAQARLAAAVFSHHHIDHVFGTRPFEAEASDQGWPAPVVYGHEEMPSHFDRYLRTRGWNAAINKRQFALPVDRFEWPDEYRYPDVTYEHRLTFHQGNLTFELRHARGETDDATWTWVPERRILHPGDLFIYAVPNAGNPQKVQRYLGEWAGALREMVGLDAELMLSGHGLPIFGADRIRQALTDTAELLESIELETVALMNEGKSLDTILHSVAVPGHLRDRPYLRPVYDHPQFLVRNVWRRFGGWYDGEPDNLLPAPRQQQAVEWVQLAGGVDRVVARARELAAAGDLRLACHLIESAVVAEPSSGEAHSARAEIYRARSQEQESSMARNVLGHAARSSEQGQRDLAGDF